jgi:predicted AlkP superfamily phosphohydrolase/phosphomutase
MQKNKVLVIGLDGVPFGLVRDWAAAGHMPVLKRLIDSGVAGELRSTMPPTSGPAWSSFATGKNPGKTGIYDFLYRKPGTYAFPPVNAAMRSGRSLWSLLGEQNRRVAVVNIPISYPVEPVNGVLISGWMTPYFATDYTHPSSRRRSRARSATIGSIPPRRSRRRVADRFFARATSCSSC